MHLTETTITTFTGEYVVEAYLTMPGDNRPNWHKVMNFGLRLGDAIDARNHDIPTMPLERLYGLIRKYDGKRMKRVRPGSYMPDNDKDNEEIAKWPPRDTLISLGIKMEDDK